MQGAGAITAAKTRLLIEPVFHFSRYLGGLAMDFSDRELTGVRVSNVSTFFRDGALCVGGDVEVTITNYDSKAYGPTVSTRVNTALPQGMSLQDAERALLDIAAALLRRKGTFDGQRLAEKRVIPQMPFRPDSPQD